MDRASTWALPTTRRLWTSDRSPGVVAGERASLAMVNLAFVGASARDGASMSGRAREKR